MILAVYINVLSCQTHAVQYNIELCACPTLSTAQFAYPIPFSEDADVAQDNERVKLDVITPLETPDLVEDHRRFRRRAGLHELELDPQLQKAAWTALYEWNRYGNCDIKQQPRLDVQFPQFTSVASNVYAIEDIRASPPNPVSTWYNGRKCYR
eukprot:GHVT01043752.1.p1 GENE.GHVT01043752.1~~GHVT01043752.1.p1  ORF type:complete len:153 (-),score=13.99 GHVT01043752.1:297-755(-)